MIGPFRRRGGAERDGEPDAGVPGPPPLRLDVPDPPEGTPYDRVEDHLNAEILRSNGVGGSDAELLRTLDGASPVLQAAAAHVLGATGGAAAHERLRARLDDVHDLVRVEAAYALARHDVPEGRDALVRCLSLPVDASVSPMIAAGYLAQLGDPQGYPAVVRALHSSIDAIRMIGCKQLFFFFASDGQPDGAGGTVDVWQLVERALADPSADVRWQTVTQLGSEPSGRGRALLDEVAAHASDAGLRRHAERLLAGSSGPA